MYTLSLACAQGNTVHLGFYFAHLCYRIAAAFGAFEMKALPQWPRIVLAASFVFYNGASLINLNVNTVRWVTSFIYKFILSIDF